MVLEATMIIVDNSEYARNGDFNPTRWVAQEEASNIVAQAKCDSNAENAVGLMLMGGKQVDILVTPIPDPGRVAASFHGVKLHGKSQLSTALQVAYLSLKHRLNKNQRQRIVCFVASPIIEDEAILVALGKKLKKAGVALDLINLESSIPEQNQKLQKLVEAIDSSDNSHYVQVQPGLQLLSDILLSTPVLMAEGGNFGGQGGDFGGQGNIDPELEMVMRISLEEERERQRKKEEEERKKNTENQGKPEEKPAEPPKQDSKIEEEKPKDLDDLDEEELFKRAQALSLEDPKPEEAPKLEEAPKTEKQLQEEALQDPLFVEELLELVGEANSVNVRKELEKLNQKKDDKSGDKKKEDEKK